MDTGGFVFYIKSIRSKMTFCCFSFNRAQRLNNSFWESVKTTADASSASS